MNLPSNTSSRTGGKANLVLVVSLLISLLILPLLEGLYASRFLFLLGLTATLIVAAFAARSRMKITALAFLVVALPSA